jgi:hypothetical protein
MVKLMMVPYISKPPMILITMAAGLISPQCENMAGNAASSQISIPTRTQRAVTHLFP